MIRLFIHLILLVWFIPFAATGQNFMAQRNKMVEEQIVKRGVRDSQVIKAMRTVKRHKFVPEQSRQMAYLDRPLPIGHNQTISQPYIVALMTNYLNLEKNDKVLEIGTGSGYQAAVLSLITPNVYSVEIRPELAKAARATLTEQGYDNVQIKTGDGFQGWKEHAPYDGIIVTASPAEIPQPLKDQLAEGGKIIIPVGGPVFQRLVLLKKTNGKIHRQEITGVRFVPMINEKGKRH
jgi:protein-L-isoaspartate(D-aspartate) O-methyltransferase